MKIVEDNLIIGFLTQTNQFIQLNTFENNTEQDNLPIINYSSYKDYYNIDKSFLLSDKIILKIPGPNLEPVKTILKG